MSNKTGGQILIELVLALGIASILISALVGGLIGVRSGTNLSTNILNANFLFQEAIEAVRSVRETGWPQLASNGTYHPVISGSNWSLVSGNEVTGAFTREIIIDDTRRDTNGNIVNAGGKIDPSTKKIKLSVSWQGYGSISSINQTFYLSRWQGNTTWIQTTQLEFDQGTKTNVVTTNISGGEVVLAPISGGSQTMGNKFIATSFSSLPLASANNWFSIRFTAQNSKLANQLGFYQNSQTGGGLANYAIELRSNNAGNPGTVLASGIYSPVGAARWVNVNLNSSVNLTSGTIYHIVIRKISGTRNLEVRFSSPLNNAIPYDGATDTASNVLFSFTKGTSWLTLNRQPIYLVGFSDNTVEGNPLHQPYDDSTSVTRIFNGNFIGEQFSVTGLNRTATNVSFYIRRISTTPPEDNLYVTLYDVTNNNLIETGILVNRTSVSTTYSWYSYVFTQPRTLIAGRTYRFFLSSPLTTNGRSYVLSAQETQNSASYIGRTFDGSNSFYAKSANSGGSWNPFSYRDVPFRYTIQSVGGYQISGTFESATFGNLGVNRGFNYLSWATNKPASTDIKFQVATSNSNGPIWNFIGPDSSAATYFINPGTIPLELVSASFIRYKAFLTGDGNNTPTLENVTVNWSP